MRKFKYQIDEYLDGKMNFPTGDKKEVDYLNTMGSLGWELVSCIHDHLHVGHVIYHWKKEVFF